MTKQSEYKLIVDTREKTPWVFSSYDVISRKLNTGDYSIEGFEDVISIERKKTTSEWATNVFEKRFHEELLRSKNLRHFYIICEFTLDDLMKFPANSGIPKYLWGKIKVSPHLLLKKTIEIQQEFPNVHIVYAGNRGKEYTSSILKRFLENVEI